MNYNIEPIAIIDTCFPEKFGIPRQSTLAPCAKGKLCFLSPYNQKDCFEGLEQVSHLWLTFIFHQHINAQWKTKVRPPRLGGNRKLGVFASRSSFRPNFIGQSLVKLERVEFTENEVFLHVSGVDLVSGTPVIDIKPYLPYADSIAGAYNHIAPVAPETMEVNFSKPAENFCRFYQKARDLKPLIIEVLRQDPRPAYQEADENRIYKMALLNLTVTWRCQNLQDKIGIYVVDIDKNESKEKRGPSP